MVRQPFRVTKAARFPQIAAPERAGSHIMIQDKGVRCTSLPFCHFAGILQRPFCWKRNEDISVLIVPQ